jgi:ring-1,2-phenylacetyl-CoA epoxidase subunit PaaC
VELFAEDAVDRAMTERGVAPDLSELHVAWNARIDEILAEATLKRPAERPYTWFGKRGEHSEHLGYLLTEMQYLPRAFPGAKW